MKTYLGTATLLLIAAFWSWRGGLLSSSAQAQSQVSASAAADVMSSEEAVRFRTCQPSHWRDLVMPTQF